MLQRQCGTSPWIIYTRGIQFNFCHGLKRRPKERPHPSALIQASFLSNGGISSALRSQNLLKWSLWQCPLWPVHPSLAAATIFSEGRGGEETWFHGVGGAQAKIQNRRQIKMEKGLRSSASHPVCLKTMYLKRDHVWGLRNPQVTATQLIYNYLQRMPQVLPRKCDFTTQHMLVLNTI